MVSETNDDGWDEPTIPCRYLLFTETESGQISVREPSCDSEPVPDAPSNRMVLVHSPSEPPPSSAGVRVSVVRPSKDDPE